MTEELKAAPAGWTNYRTRVLVPDFKEEDLPWLKNNEPFIISAELSHSAQFIQVTELPTILGMLGLSGPPGLYGYAFFTTQDKLETVEPYLFLSAMVGFTVCLPDEVASWDVMAVSAVGGVLVSHIMFRGEGVPKLIESFSKTTAHVVPAKDYVVPKEVLSQVMSRRGVV